MNGVFEHRVLFSLYSLEIQLVFLDLCRAGGVREKTPAFPKSQIPKSQFYLSSDLQDTGADSPLQLLLSKLNFLFIAIHSVFKFTGSAGFRMVWEV